MEEYDFTTMTMKVAEAFETYDVIQHHYHKNQSSKKNVDKITGSGALPNWD